MVASVRKRAITQLKAMLLALGQNAFKQQMGAIQLEASNMQAAMPQRHCLMKHRPGV